ncbi:MAG: hypothetical protein MZV64_38645 [Ignavibacteriales bacterium]|nr:hypothetical protein [Ignavibacteriales bacterium]
MRIGYHLNLKVGKMEHWKVKKPPGMTFGFRQVLGEVAALNITLFYKNIRGLVNDAASAVQTNRRRPNINCTVQPELTDFGTTKGLAFSFDISRLNYLSISAQYYLFSR